MNLSALSPPTKHTHALPPAVSYAKLVVERFLNLALIVLELLLKRNTLDAAPGSI
jgi:hypothetical protein